MKYEKGNVLCIPDPHIPFEHRDFLDFCRYWRERCHCGTVVFLGDLVDNHAVSQYAYDPDGLSAGDEIVEAERHLEKWFKFFPDAYFCLGNHDRRPDRKGKTAGIPTRFFRDFREVWRTPKGWRIGLNWELYGVIYTHGSRFTGANSYMRAAYDNRQSTVIGHLHTELACGYIANEKSNIFGMNCGCGIDEKKYAFAYQRENRKRPILGCGVTTDYGKFCQVFPLEV